MERHFFHREKEINELRALAEQPGCHCSLIYGRRRIGKSTLVRHALSSLDSIYIEFESQQILYEANMRNLAKTVSQTIGQQWFSSLTNLSDLLSALASYGEKIVLFIDEYQFLKNGFTDGNLDSVFQNAVDQLDGDLLIVLCGSYISMMRKLEESDSPLYGRLSLSLQIKAFDYLDSSAFYPNLTERDKVAFYSVFGGMPFCLEQLKPGEGLESNIKRLLLNPSSLVFSSIKETLLKEIWKIDLAETLLGVIGNGKKKNNDLSSAINTSNVRVSQECNRMIQMDILEKVVPINRKQDQKKTFYAISDNLIKFFYHYVIPNLSALNRFGADYVWNKYIEPTLTEFISKQFESIVNEYFTRCIKANPNLDCLDIGTYWYDLPKKRANGEFDCVIAQSKGYFIVEVKYLSGPMGINLLDAEIKKMEEIDQLKVSGKGFVSIEGFEDIQHQEINIAAGQDLYDEESIQSGGVLSDWL